LVHNVRCRLRGYSPQEADAVVVLDPLVPGRRLGRAVAGFGICFGAAILAVLIPVAHFVLVPGLLAAAFVVFAVRLSVATLVVSAHGTCPDCGADQDLDLLGPWKGFREVTCRACHRPLQLRPAEGPSTPQG